MGQIYFPCVTSFVESPVTSRSFGAHPHLRIDWDIHHYPILKVLDLKSEDLWLVKAALSGDHSPSRHFYGGVAQCIAEWRAWELSFFGRTDVIRPDGWSLSGSSNATRNGVLARTGFNLSNSNTGQSLTIVHSEYGILV